MFSLTFWNLQIRVNIWTERKINILRAKIKKKKEREREKEGDSIEKKERQREI